LNNQLDTKNIESLSHITPNIWATVHPSIWTSDITENLMLRRKSWPRHLYCAVLIHEVKAKCLAAYSSSMTLLVFKKLKNVRHC